MNEKSYNVYAEMTDFALMQHIGAFIKDQRLQQNKTQASVAGAAGISRSTLSLLEHGETVTTTTLIQVLRVLDLLHVMDFFKIQKRISPIALAKMDRDKRKRARSTGDKKTKSAW